MQQQMPVQKTAETSQLHFPNTVVNKSVQHVVNTVAVETPRIIKEAVRGKKVIQEKINQVTKHVEVPLVQFLNKVDDMPVAVQRQIPMVQTVEETKETPQLQVIDKVVDDPVVQVPRVQVLEKTAEIPQLQNVEKIGEIPQTRTIQGTQAPESLAITPVCQVRQTRHVEELVEVSKVFSPDTVQQRFGKQMIEIPADTQTIQSARTSERSVTAPVCQTTQVEIGEVIADWSVNPRRIRFIHIRDSTCLGKFSSCCWV